MADIYFTKIDRDSISGQRMKWGEVMVSKLIFATLVAVGLVGTGKLYDKRK